MKASERAAQLWAVLALAARNRQVLTYDLVAQLTGVARQGLGQLLEPIQSYCIVKNLPPLTALVVKQGKRTSELWVHRSRRSRGAGSTGSRVRAGLALAWLPDAG